METTRATITLDLKHRPDIDLPARVARTVQDALGSAEGIGAVEVVCGEMGDLMWMPHGARADSEAARLVAERRPEDAPLEVRNLRGHVQATEARVEAARARDRARAGRHPEPEVAS